MTYIKDEVLFDHLRQYPHEREILLPFLNNFDVTWGRRRSRGRTSLSIYFLSAAQFIRDQFGFDSEILLAVSDYPSVQPRTMQVVEQFLQEDPAQGRVDPIVFFLVNRAPNAEAWVREYATVNRQSRIAVVFNTADLFAHRADQWHVRSVISSQLYSRDLFNDQLPLENDLFFFGRTALAAEFLDSIKQSQNRGLFGLRKTGKTSLLYKLDRMSRRENVEVFYYDCKDPPIRTLHWDQFLERIIADITARFDRRASSLKQAHVSDKFKEILTSVSKEKRICLIFDEIEFVSPMAELDLHWRTEFVPFWQTMWTAQSRVRRLSFILAGVNPKVVELDVVNQVQNPVFGIVSPKYLTGFDETEVRAMLHHFGKRMGLHFEAECVKYILDRYGGHPLLTRMACSFLNTILRETRATRPVVVTKDLFLDRQTEIEEEVSFYCRHVVSELVLFYPDEYYMLEVLASGNVADFIELGADPDNLRHLRHYGLIGMEATNRPRIKIPVVERYINHQRARREKSGTDKYVVPLSTRNAWLINRTKRIADDFRLLARLAEANKLPALSERHGFPEAERFCGMMPSSNRDDFVNFINVCNRCFVEFVEAVGKRIGEKDYFWRKINIGYPDLWNALHRIKIYRNEELHLELRTGMDQALQTLLSQDLQGKRMSQLAEPYFMLQQAVVDELFVGLQCELDRVV